MSAPAERAQTVRAAIREVLEGRTLDAREISALVSVSEREVVEHLSHLMQGRPPVRMTPPRCRQCGFSFDKRARSARPSRCPQCRSERIEAPRFSL
ncbi:MAG: transcriptional regulator [Polyangiaceae bacterium]